MLVYVIKVNWYNNPHFVVDICSDFNDIIKLFGNTDIFKIQFSCSSLECTKFVDLFVKSFALMNIRESLRNYKMCSGKN